MHYLVSTALLAASLFSTTSIADVVSVKNVPAGANDCSTQLYLVEEGYYTVTWYGTSPYKVSDFYIYIPDMVNSNAAHLLDGTGPSGKGNLQADDDGPAELCVGNKTDGPISVDVAFVFHSNGNTP